MTELEKYYTKFNEEHRLTTRHGQVEFFTSMHFIHKYLKRLGFLDKNKISENKSAASASVSAKPPVSCTKPPVSSATAALKSALSANPVALSSTQAEISSTTQISAPPPKILDLGAGTGRYAISLAREGFDVTAVELVKKNLDVMNSKHERIKIWPGNALDLHFLQDETFDITIMFGPLYHLQTKEEKLKALSEARRVTKKNGIIFAAYIMNEYSVLMYAFLKHKIKDCVKNQTLTKDFHALTTEKDLYSYLRLEDINELQKLSGLKRLEMFAQDGPSDYMRQMLNSLDEEEFSLFLEYHLATCQRPELLGASSHVVDILQK